jgi:NADH dehydrogenase
MFGLGDRLISGMIRLLQRTGLLLIPGTGKTMLQPIWVGDVVSCLLRALRGEEALDRTIPIGGPQHLTYEEIADQVGKMLNIPRVKVHLSRRAVAWVTRLLEGLGLNPFLGYRHLELLEVGTITALDAVRRSFGFQPMPLIEGVAYHILPRREVGASGPPSGVVRGSRTRDRR